ncbi:hypothetical protein AURDEDRAFT_174906 [Auricularia subglabra TFB-10046 SS5]|uniref:NAD(P)-binding protein n=1 Tax=Auricularia subglabra (strain TFB-10046 / SS5) TaxID=717982 RepID=J0LFD4_AURST|nr:hypothetical protein AURDEDRAFT_174906 [Auricularia subglabra TFB-10046 SS5]
MRLARWTSQGIGLELTKELAKTDTNTVIATCRAPERAAALASLAAAHVNLHAVALRVLSDASVQSALAAAQPILSERGVDYVNNNTGTVHVVGALRVFRAFLPRVRAGNSKVVMNVNSVCGSIGCDVGPVDAAYKALQMYAMVKQHPDLVIFAFEPAISTCVRRLTASPRFM